MLSKYSSFFKSTANFNKPKKTEADYEEVGPLPKKNEINEKLSAIMCDLCGSHVATVRCDRCSNQAFCLSCDDMYHKHPRRASHIRKAVDRKTVDRGTQRPPLPPKTDCVMSPPPQPPPRKNKRSGLFNIEHGGIICSKRRSSVGGELLGPRIPFMGTGSSDEGQSSKPFSMEGRPLPPTPDNSRSNMIRAGSAGNLVQVNGNQQQQELRNSNHMHQAIMAPNATPEHSYKPPPFSHARKLSLQQFPFMQPDKNASVMDTGQFNAEQPPKIPQKMRSQSISDDQWKKTVLAAKGNEVDGQLPKQQYNPLGFPYPVPHKRGMVSSASISNLSAPNAHMQPGMQQMSMIPYNPNAMWMACPQCHHQAFHHQHQPPNNGMKRTTSNVSMNMSVNSESSFPWSMPPHAHHHMPVYPGYFQGYPQGMSRHGSNMSIPDSVHSFGKSSFSPAPSTRSKKSHMSRSRFGPPRSKGHSRRGSSNDSISSYESDENLAFDRHKPQKSGSLSWQCNHCTYMNSGHTQICGMCSKNSADSESRNRKHSDRFKQFPSDSLERHLSDLDTNRQKTHRERYKDRSRRASSTKSSVRGRRKSRQRDSIDSNNSLSISDSPPEEKVQKQFSALSIQRKSRTGVYEGLPPSRNRYRNKRKEEKKQIRKRSQSAHGRTQSPVREKFTRLSLTSSGSELSNEVFSRSPSPEQDDINEQRISSIEATILASIISNQMSKGNSKEPSINLNPKIIENINTDDLYTKVIKSRLAIEDGSIKIETEQNEDAFDDNIIELSEEANLGSKIENKANEIENNEDIEDLNEINDASSLSIEVDDDNEEIKYIDDLDDVEVENIMSLHDTSIDDIDNLENHSDKAGNDLDAGNTNQIEDDPRRQIQAEEKITKSSAASFPKVNNNTVTNEKSPIAIAASISPTSISSSEANFYSPVNSPSNSPDRILIPNKSFSDIDRGFETDYYGDEDLVTALESLENSEDESSSICPPSSVDSIHSSLEQLSFDEVSETKDTTTTNACNDNESFASKILNISKSLSEQALSAKMHIPLLNKIVTKAEEVRDNDKKRKQTLKEQGLQLVQYFREAEEKNYDPEEVSIAMTQVDGGNPVEWLEENWSAMIDTVKTLATNYGVGKESNDIGNVTELEARKALRLHKGEVWAAVTECVNQRQEMYNEITSKGNFKSEDILKALEVACGNVAEAFLKLTQVNQIGKFLINMWSSKGEEVQSTVEEDESSSPDSASDETESEIDTQDESENYANETESTGTVSEEDYVEMNSEIGSTNKDPITEIKDASVELPSGQAGNIESKPKVKQEIQVMPRLKQSDIDKISLKAAYVHKLLKNEAKSSSKQDVHQEDTIDEDKPKTEKIIEEDMAGIGNELAKNNSEKVKMQANDQLSSNNDKINSTNISKNTEAISKNITDNKNMPISADKNKASDKSKTLDNSSSSTDTSNKINTETVKVVTSVSKSDKKIAHEKSTSVNDAKCEINQALAAKSTIELPQITTSNTPDDQDSALNSTSTNKLKTTIKTSKKFRGSKIVSSASSTAEEINVCTDIKQTKNIYKSDIESDSREAKEVKGKQEQAESSIGKSFSEKDGSITRIEYKIASNKEQILITEKSNSAGTKAENIKNEEDINLHESETKEDSSLAVENNAPAKPAFKKATLIVGKAVAKAMAREAVVKEKSGSVSPMPHSVSPAKSPSIGTSENMESEDEISEEESDDFDEGDQIEEVGSSESDGSSKDRTHSPSIEDRTMESKSTIPAAVESFSGPIFIPCETPPHSITSKLGRHLDQKDAKSRESQMANKATNKGENSKSATVKNQFAKLEPGITSDKLEASPSTSRHSSISPEKLRRDLSKSPIVDDVVRNKMKVDSKSGGSTMESPEETDEEDMEESNLNSADIEEEFQKVQRINEQIDYITHQLEAEAQAESDQEEEQESKEVPEEDAAAKVQREQENDQLKFERNVRRLLAEGHTSTYEKAEIAAHLVNLSFDEYDSVQAAEECDSIYSAMRFLRQECELCAERYPMGKMVSMLHCIHRCCYQCAQNYFTFQIKAKNIRELKCPFCNQPDLDANEDVTTEYFNNLDILLKGIIDEETHELFQRKIRDLTLMKDPNFRWCNKCSSGFIANPRARKLVCPDCKEVTCAQCKHVWELQHEGITCEDFARWKEENDPESQAKGVEKHLAECGITCPQCRFTYALAKGGCMHFTCNECKFEFCSGCSQPFKQGAKCNVGPYCERLGLHAHHPRNCLFYLRDKEPAQLQELLKEHDIPFDVDPIYDGPLRGSCRVQEQKETFDGLIDDQCGRTVLKGHAGLCKLHYVEYLVETINNHALDPVTIFDEADLRVCLRRNGKTVPVRRWESEKLYRKKLIKLIQEQLPLS